MLLRSRPPSRPTGPSWYRQSREIVLCPGQGEGAICHLHEWVRCPWYQALWQREGWGPGHAEDHVVNSEPTVRLPVQGSRTSSYSQKYDGQPGHSSCPLDHLTHKAEFLVPSMEPRFKSCWPAPRRWLSILTWMVSNWPPTLVTSVPAAHSVGYEPMEWPLLGSLLEIDLVPELKSSINTCLFTRSLEIHLSS